MSVERDEVKTMIEQEISVVRFSIREMTADVSRLKNDLQKLYDAVIGAGESNTLIAKVNLLVSPEERRTGNDAEILKIRRQLLVTLVSAVILSGGAILWGLSKILIK